MAASTAARLLVGSPAIRDGIFDQAVVLMLHHDDVGALGVVLNRPSELAIDELLPRWADACSEPASVFNGGPVQLDGFIGVALTTPSADEAVVMGVDDTLSDKSRFGTVDLDADPTLAAPSISALRIFRGHAGWGPGQLDDELRRGAWFTVDALSSDLTDSDPETLYERVMRRQSGELRWFANAPIDPSVN